MPPSFSSRPRFPRRFLPLLDLFLWLSLLALPAWASDAPAAAATHAPDMTHRMMMLMLQLGAIIFGAKLGGMLFERLKLPGVLGELFAGVLLGPFLLGGVPLPGMPQGLFYLPPSMSVSGFAVSAELYGICTLASIILLFLVGLETDLKLFMRYSVAGSLVGVGGVVVSFLAGAFMTVAISPFFFGEQLGFMDPPCLFLGIISTATSVGITARVLSQLRKLESPEGVTVLAGAVVDDVLGIILLAIGMGVIAASQASGAIDWGQIGRIAFKAIAIWLMATVVGLIAARRISKALKHFKSRTVIASMALGLALILAGLFEEAKLAMIIGAYVMGLSLSRTDLSHVIQERLHLLSVLLVPVFFCVMGMMVDVRLLASPKVLMVGVLYSLLAAASKMIGCGVPAYCAGFNVRGALRVGIGMLPRSEVTLIIAGTGLAAGILTEEVFGVVIFMTFFAALLAPWLLTVAFRNPASGVRTLPGKEGDGAGAPLQFAFSSSRTAEMLISSLRDAFEAEGFFCHTLDREKHLYQMRKDAMVLGVRRVGSEIQFDCREVDRAFVSTAMVEVVADLERTIRELRKPLDAEAIRRRQQSGSGVEGRSASLKAYLAPELLCPRLRGGSKEAVIDELLACLQSAGRLSDVAAARQAVMQREESLSTGMQYGIAIPHGRTDAVASLVCAIGLKPEGVDFDSIDGKPSRIFVLALSPANVPSPHMQFMSMVAQSLNEEGRAALLACDTAEEMFAVLTGTASLDGARVRKRDRVMGIVGIRRPAVTASMADHLRVDRIVVGLKATTKEGVIDELLAVCVGPGGVSSVDTVRRAILEREAQMSTGMEHGIAIPHARTAAVDRMICALGTSAKGIDYGSMDGEPSRIFVLTLSPADTNTPHMQFMAMVSRALDEEGRKAVLTAKTPAQVLAAMTAK